MENASRPLRFPTLEDIVKLNRRHIEQGEGMYVGVDNLKEQGSLECVLDAIQYTLFDVDRYPDLVEKAARLTWIIISGHVFWDGNKRTGMSVLYIFLRLNDYQLDVTNDETVGIACRVADRDSEEHCSYEEFVQWVRDRIIPRREPSHWL
jgi:death-on-curing protein